MNFEVHTSIYLSTPPDQMMIIIALLGKTKEPLLNIGEPTQWVKGGEKGLMASVCVLPFPPADLQIYICRLLFTPSSLLLSPLGKRRKDGTLAQLNIPLLEAMCDMALKLAVDNGRRAQDWRKFFSRLPDFDHLVSIRMIPAACFGPCTPKAAGSRSLWMSLKTH